MVGNAQLTPAMFSRLARNVCLCCAVVIGVMWGADERSSWAQSTAEGERADSGTSAAPTPRGPKSSVVEDDDGPTIIYKIDEKTGKREPILFVKPGQTPEQALEELRSRKQSPAPAANISKLSLTGEIVRGDRAELTAKIAIQVPVDDQFVSIPLRLNEATLLGAPKYEGPGRAYPAAPAGKSGLVWWILGKGDHQLTLKLSVPVVSKTTKPHLQLSLPPTAVSELTLKMLSSNVSATVHPKDAGVPPVITKNNGGTITVAGLGTAFDMSWEPLRPKARPILEVDNTVSVEFDATDIFLQARQQIRAIDGTGYVDRLSIDLPRQAEFLSVSGVDIAEQRFDEQHPETVHLQLAEPTKGPIDLTWNLKLNREAEGEKVSCSGFHVHDAKRESGVIGLRTRNDHQRLAVDSVQQRHVRRINVADTKKQFPDAPDEAYRFDKQPFELWASTFTVEPRFSVSPRLLLTVSEDKLDLECLFQYRVLRGELSEVIVDWKEWKNRGWELSQPFEPDAFVLERIEEDDQIKFRLAQEIGPTFSIRLKAYRAIPGSSRLDFELPFAAASRRTDTYFVIFKEDNIEVQLKPGAETVARLLETPLPRLLRFPDRLQDLRHTAYQLNSTPQQFSAEISVHSPSVQTSSLVNLLPSPEKLSVEQTISYTVAWSKQNQVSLLVPDSLKERIQGDRIVVRTSSETGTAVPIWQNSGQPGRQRLTLQLDQPRTDRFQVIVPYEIDFDTEFISGAEEELTIPVIESLDSEYETTQFEVQRSNNVQVEFADDRWRSQTDVGGTTFWSTDQSVDEIPVTITRARPQSRQHTATVTKAYIRTTIDAARNYDGTAFYMLRDVPDRIEFVMPASIELTGLKWDGRQVPAEAIGSDAASPGRYRVPLTQIKDTRQGVFEISFGSRGVRTPSLADNVQLAAPQLPLDHWSARVVWSVAPPENSLLFLDPAGYTSDHRWQRSGLDGLLWERVPHQSDAELLEWVGATSTEADAADHRYQFSRLAAPIDMQLKSMSWPMIVAVGSGFALILGLMFQYFPVTRSSLVLLGLGFLVATAGIWYTAPVLLLLQASVVGLVLALVSALIQGFIRRRRSAVVTVPSASGYVPSGGSSFEHEMVALAGSRQSGAKLEQPASGSVPSSTATGASS